MDDVRRLVAAAQGGDQLAFDELFNRHRSRLSGYIASRMDAWMRAHLEADDLVQETHAEAARKIGDFELREPRSFYRWLVRISQFKLREAHRRMTAKKRGTPGHLEQEPAVSATSVTARAVRSEQIEQAVAAMAELSPARAEAVRLRYLEGLTVPETADRMARSPSAVKALVARALADLARSLRDQRTEFRNS